jgi:hypothetical protein
MEALKNTSMMIILAGIFYGAYQMFVSEPPNWQKKNDSTEMITASDPMLPQQNVPQQNPVQPNLAPQNFPPQNLSVGANPGVGNLSGSPALGALPSTSTQAPRQANPESFSQPSSGNPPVGNLTASGSQPLVGSTSPGLPSPGLPTPGLPPQPSNNIIGSRETGFPPVANPSPLAQAGFSESSALPPAPGSALPQIASSTGLPPSGLGNSGLPVQPAGLHQPLDRVASNPSVGLPSAGLPSSPDLLPIRSQPGVTAAPPSPSAPLTATQQLKSAMEMAGVDIQNNQWAKALRDLSAWYQQPISVEDRDHLVGWLDRLAGDVIYSSKHTLAAGHPVQAGETLASIATRYQMPARLLARINQYPDSIADETPLQAGVELKVIPGPFTAEADLQLGQLTLFAGGLYAGRFKFRTGESAPLDSLNEPVAFVSVQGIPAQEDQRRHEPLAPTNPFGRYCLVVGQTAVLHSPGGNSQGSCLEFSEQDMLDLMVLLPRGTMVRVVK